MDNYTKLKIAIEYYFYERMDILYNQQNIKEFNELEKFDNTYELIISEIENDKKDN